MKAKIVTVIVVALLVAAIPGANGRPAPKVREDADKFVLENDFVRVWFQGKKPMLKVSPANAAEDDNATSFGYKIRDLVEYRDLNGDGAPSQNEVLASLNLDRANEWNVTTSEEDGVVVLNLTMDAPVKLGKSGLTENVTLGGGTALVTLVFTIRDAATTLDVDGVNVSIPATSVKYDLRVDRWPFVNAELDRLALETEVTGQLALENETGIETAEVLSNETSIGALSWTTNATGTDADGANITVGVRTAVARGLNNETMITHTYDAANLATLLHDPTVGTTSTAASLKESTDGESPVPALGVLLVAVAAGAAALVVGRHRR